MFYENLIAELERQGLKITPVITKLGISSGSIGPWKRGGSVNSDALLKLSEYLGVTTDYLLKGYSQDNKNSLYCTNKTEELLLTMYRSIPRVNQEFIYDAIKAAYDREMANREDAAANEQKEKLSS